ncbi:helix-turn-helix transcriptional regulator [Rhodococcus ruber]|uniref:helix-turn-helix transcriptional regulator n=1 Tax=Rhodococcus ruber TaxID=1830 RepID=UPI00265FEEA9|nr:helix-turn-helix domain-containing protein [Rhodococcus ruber]MDO1481427.1 helix-turn-helix domain-containing protein [Rhodococcus ruber]
MSTESIRHPLATPREVAEFLRTSEFTLLNHRRSGTGPQFRKVGGLIRYDWQDVYAWVDANAMQRAGQEG